jgi:ElaB/YqjD/DUF883 family membrane-anchored ribosome-binding protein
MDNRQDQSHLATTDGQHSTDIQRPAHLSDADGGDRVVQIRREIAATRAEMGATVDAIQYKLDPNRLKAQAKESVREATVGRAERLANEASDTAREASTTMMETIKQNPLPAAMAAIGLGWLFMKSRESTTGSRPPYGAYSGEHYWRGGYQGQPTYGGTTYQEQGGVGHAAGQMREQAGERMGQAREQAGEMVGQVRDTAGEVVDQARERIGDLGSEAQYQTRRAKGQFERMIDSNPLGVGVAAVAIGSVVGMMLPETEQEHRTFGPVKDRAMEQARGMVEDTQEKVRHVAEEAGKAAQHEAEKQNLTS